MAPLEKPIKTPSVSTGKKSKLIKALLALIFIAAVAGDVYFYKQLQVKQQDPQVVAEQETQELIAKIGALIVLPEGETPTVATVNEPEKLVDQPFFAKAQKGDKVLIYTNAKKAILYSPSTNKIVEVAPLNIGTPSTETPVAPASTETNQ